MELPSWIFHSHRVSSPHVRTTPLDDISALKIIAIIVMLQQQDHDELQNCFLSKLIHTASLEYLQQLKG